MAAALTACGSDNNAGGSGASGDANCDGKDKLTAEGSSAQKNAMDGFIAAWGQACPGKTLEYNATGSGTGRNQFIAGNVDFGGSDSPLAENQVQPAAQRCGGNPAWNLPVVFGPVALVYNVEGVDGLVLNADVIARIFNGGIKTWNDPAIAALNAGKSLPSQPIVPIFRTGESGTTDNFQKYLAAAAPQSWTQGAGSTFNGGVGEGANGSAGVQQAVAGSAGSIGYVEKSYVGNLSAAQIDTGSGAVELTDETAGKAISAAKFAGEGNDLVLDLKSLYATKEPGAYPLVLATYEIVCSKGYDAETAAAVKSFLKVAAGQGQASLSAAGYVPLPDAFKQRLVTAIDAISA
ncbi:phosphate ABC transporter substrate-binding protein PstS [Mycobacterium sp. MYCO198283]|nr:phosphate ABC transporter substrate-binding protein PstS [Mycobacterium sp. MYCO198283]MCG5431279.1 phosphate ABC transporter substrate-binding protein PstS [Mycobacterium sp. MYCO198283]